MSEFSETGFNVADYSNFRPMYPDEWYRTLNEFHKGNRNLAIDVGCGPGTATFDIRKKLDFQKVIGADISAPMIDRARGRAAQANEPVEFVVYSGDLTDIKSRDNPLVSPSPDLITMAECAHWLDWESIEAQVAQVLPSQGTLAVWGYVDPVFVDFPILDDEIETLQYGSPPDGLGPYWQQPGRQRLRDLFPQLPASEKWFTDIKLWRQDARPTHGNTQSPLTLEKSMTLEAFDNYTKTWSSYNRWQSLAKSDDAVAAVDPRDVFLKKVETHTNLKSRDIVRVAWKTVAMLARRK
ncbi:unnamed protein product [Kluyveromyces dobzhanskii CBS 2104]|uniref:WGS project CCBQ000000000 data, contig 00009 n=1 Tax=Kluyveromyces dobzhanskii CBS 2104 TaxID=1427455 RepID=A0A0A8L5E9_9SACH|nr:unnamed protein product [Kluyveromyces dobzhanskii CBS 2104]